MSDHPVLCKNFQANHQHDVDFWTEFLCMICRGNCPLAARVPITGDNLTRRRSMSYCYVLEMLYKHRLCAIWPAQHCAFVGPDEGPNRTVLRDDEHNTSFACSSKVDSRTVTGAIPLSRKCIPASVAPPIWAKEGFTIPWRGLQPGPRTPPTPMRM